MYHKDRGKATYHLEYKSKRGKIWRPYAPFYPTGTRPSAEALSRLKRQVVMDETVYRGNGKVYVPDLEFRLVRTEPVRTYEYLSYKRRK